MMPVRECEGSLSRMLLVSGRNLWLSVIGCLCKGVTI